MLFKSFFSLYLIPDCVEEMKAIVLAKPTGFARKVDGLRPFHSAVLRYALP
jgi:hypothetical protein